MPSPSDSPEVISEAPESPEGSQAHNVMVRTDSSGKDALRNSALESPEK